MEVIGTVLRDELAERFLQEANRLLQSEGSRTSLPTSQAVCLMYAAVAARDQTNLGAHCTYYPGMKIDLTIN
jgi:hypothetical protein